MSFWNEEKDLYVHKKTAMGRMGNVLLGVKEFPTIMYKQSRNFADFEHFKRKAVSFSVPKNAFKIIIIAPPRYGKTTLVNRIKYALRYDFNHRIVSIQPKGEDDYYANKQGFGKMLGYGEFNCSMDFDLYAPVFSFSPYVPEMKHYNLVSYPLKHYEPVLHKTRSGRHWSIATGFLELDSKSRKQFNTGVYSSLQSLYLKNPELFGANAEQVLKFLMTKTVTSNQEDPRWIFYAHKTALITRLQNAIGYNFLSEKHPRISIYDSWVKNRSVSLGMFQAQDELMNSFTGGFLKQLYDYRLKVGKYNRFLTIFGDDIASILSDDKDKNSHYGMKQIMDGIQFLGSKNINFVLIFHSMDEVPSSLLTWADYIIVGRLSEDLGKLKVPRNVKERIQKLYGSSTSYYKQWYFIDKGNQMYIPFYNIDCPVGLKKF